MPKNTNNTKTFALNVYPVAIDSSYLPNGYDCFVVEINLEYAKHLLRLVRTMQTLQRRFKDIYKLEFWDRSGDYHAADDAPDGAPPSLTILGDATRVPTGDPSRTECKRLMVTVDAIHWTAYPKHCDVEIETEELPLAEIQGIAEAAGSPVVSRSTRRGSEKRP